MDPLAGFARAALIRGGMCHDKEILAGFWEPTTGETEMSSTVIEYTSWNTSSIR